MSLRSRVIRFAASLPKGNKTRRALLDLLAVQLPSEEDRGKPSYDDDFKAGFKAGQEALKKNPDADSTDGKRAYKRVSMKHGSWWLEGFNAAIDLSRGANQTKPAQIATKMRLT